MKINNSTTSLMKKNEAIVIYVGFILVMFFSITNMFSQKQDEIYRYYNTVVGIENTGIFKGIEYIDENAVLNANNKFLIPKARFTKGWIVYYNQYYPDIKMKYNLVDDKIIVELDYDNRESSFQLITSRISKFAIEGHTFLRLDNIGDLKAGFYESIYSDDKHSIYKKLRKKEFRRMDKQYLYYEYFTDDPIYFYINNENKAYPVNNLKDFVKVFPEKKKNIRQFYKDQEILNNQNLDKFNQMLMAEVISN